MGETFPYRPALEEDPDSRPRNYCTVRLSATYMPELCDHVASHRATSAAGHAVCHRHYLTVAAVTVRGTTLLFADKATAVAWLESTPVRA